MILEPIDVGVLFAAAFATSILSAIVGMAGGITLLTVMLLYLEPLVAIPIHGVVQPDAREDTRAEHGVPRQRVGLDVGLAREVAHFVAHTH